MNPTLMPVLTKYRVAALQMVSGPDVARNCEAAGELIAEAAGEGAQLLVLPEYFPLISAADEDRLGACEQPGKGPIQEFLSQSAARHGVWLIGGTLPLEAKAAGKLRNTSLVVDAGGTVVARYDKIHLFGFSRAAEIYNERRTIEAGEVPTVVDTPFGRIGLSICYDLRFPELYRGMGVLDLIVVPSAFTYPTGEAHWEVLLRARAIENQCYLIAAAQGGRHPSGRLTYGHSMVVGPWGEVLSSRDEGAGVVLADVDLGHSAAVRESLPALLHRRL